MTDRKVAKIILEIRFPHAALLFDKRGSIARKWRGVDYLTDWQIANNEVTLHNKEQTAYFNVRITRVSSVLEFPENLNDFCKFASDFSFYVLEALNVRELSRIGLRVLQFEERNDFNLLMNKIREKLCPTSDEDWAQLGVSVKDVGPSYVFKLNDSLGNLNLGPMERNQLSSYFTSKESQNKLPDVSLFIDFDLFRTNLSYQTLSSKGKLTTFLCTRLDEIITFTDNFVQFYGGFE